ncbi:MAG: DUF2752 domain-containing protein [Ilumatobacteraceae bacterium]
MTPSMAQSVERMQIAASDSRLRAISAPIACGCALAAAAMYVALDDPSGSGVHLPACPLYQMTGLWCPGCGLTRATHAVLRGHIGAAFGFNPFFPLFLGGIVAAWLAWIRRSLGRPPVIAVSRWPLWLPIAAGVLLIAFGVVRNLPGFEALRP